jgi:glutamyl-Q tRNA(Asp) synthetase
MRKLAARQVQGRPAWRLHVTDYAPPLWCWNDRRLGPQQQCLASEVGDFVLLRSDGCWAYQLAVVVDDAAQGITDIVRGEDLADNTPRQQWLQRCLDLPHPRMLHLPLVRDAAGEKLSKQHGAQALDLRSPLVALHEAAAVLGLNFPPFDVAARSSRDPLALRGWLATATAQWHARWVAPKHSSA